MSRISVLIFDLDLTLCDNSERKIKAIERALNREIPENLVLQIKSGISFNVILDKMQIHSNKEDALNASLEHFFYDEDLFQLDRPFENAVETVTKLADEGYRIYYLTGRPIKKTAMDFITRFGFPEGKIYASKVGMGESHKKIRLFRRILREAKVEPIKAVAIGDLPGDALAAKQEGIAAIGTYQGFSAGRRQLEKVCDLVIGNIVDLPEVLNHLNQMKVHTRI